MTKFKFSFYDNFSGGWVSPASFLEVESRPRLLNVWRHAKAASNPLLKPQMKQSPSIEPAGTYSFTWLPKRGQSRNGGSGTCVVKSYWAE